MSPASAENHGWEATGSMLVNSITSLGHTVTAYEQGKNLLIRYWVKQH